MRPPLKTPQPNRAGAAVPNSQNHFPGTSHDPREPPSPQLLPQVNGPEGCVGGLDDVLRLGEGDEALRAVPVVGVEGQGHVGGGGGLWPSAQTSIRRLVRVRLHEQIFPSKQQGGKRPPRRKREREREKHSVVTGAPPPLGTLFSGQ